MKKILVLATLLVFPLVTLVAQQIPNNSFENWTTVGNYEYPDGWDNLNATTDSGGVYTCTKGTPGNPGSFFLSLTAYQVPNMGIVPGVAVCGVLDQATRQPVSGIPFDQRPEKLTGKWQYMMYGTGKGFIEVLLTKWDELNLRRDTVAYRHYTLNGMVMSWASFAIPLIYKSGSYPDSCIIFLSSSGTVPAEFDYLWVDDLAFTGTVITSDREQKSEAHVIRCFPNPVTDYFRISLAVNSSEPVQVRIFDGTGALVNEVSKDLVPGENTIRVGTADLKPGLYLMTLRTQSWSQSMKVVVE